MSDQSDALTEGEQAAESAETAQAAVDTDSSQHPWGDDFDAERAWSTITKQREAEKELKDRLRQAESVWEDEQALQARLSELGYEVDADTVTDDDDYEEDDVTPVDPRVEKHDEWIRQQQEQQALKDFNEDLDTAAGESSVTLTARDRRTILQESMANGFNPDATRKALKDLVEDREQLRKSWQEELQGSKKAPHVPSGGKTATQVPDLDNDQERQRWMAERLRAMNDS